MTKKDTLLWAGFLKSQRKPPTTFQGCFNFDLHHFFTWKMPRTEASGELQSMGSQRVRHD